MRQNTALLSDSYKMGHYNMYLEGTEYVYSYFEARKGAKYEKTLFFGLQYLIQEYLSGSVISPVEVREAKELIDAHLGPDVFNYNGWMYIAEELGGRLPLEIKAVPEGTRVPVDNVLMTVVNTDPKCFWLTNYVETILTQVWNASTVATKSHSVKEMLLDYASKTGAPSDIVDFQLHDFGMRSSASLESSATGGAGHLLSFMGTDTISALTLIKEHYGMNCAGFSVAATEHSIMTSNPKDEEEIYHQLFKNYPTGILSIVADSYDIFNCVENIFGGTFQETIMNRDGVTVVRPDSGDPVTTTLKILEILAKRFPSSTNEAGFTVLDPHIRVLWGDGINPDGIRQILDALVAGNWSTENMVFGMGGHLLQSNHRDDQRFAFKCSAQYRDGEWHDIYKDPIDKSKASKRGKLKLCRGTDNHMWTERADGPEGFAGDILETVFLNGGATRKMGFEEIRENVNK